MTKGNSVMFQAGGSSTAAANADDEDEDDDDDEPAEDMDAFEESGMLEMEEDEVRINAVIKNRRLL